MHDPSAYVAMEWAGLTETKQSATPVIFVMISSGSRRPLINGRSDVTEVVADSTQRLRMPDKQVAARLEFCAQPLDQVRLRCLAEVDHHVPAKDDGKRRRDRQVLN